MATRLTRTLLATLMAHGREQALHDETLPVGTLVVLIDLDTDQHEQSTAWFYAWTPDTQGGPYLYRTPAVAYQAAAGDEPPPSSPEGVMNVNW